MKEKALTFAFGALVIFVASAHAADSPDEDSASSDKYGIGQIVIPPAEQAEDQKYGGFPNNKQFNNNTKCSKVVALFDKPGMNPAQPEMAAFLSYARVKLIEADSVVHAFQHTKLVIDLIGKDKWKVLPALYPVYCRSHTRETLETASLAVILSARMLPLFDHD